jgi:cell wall-associated NlpC family hydrolase
VLSVRSLRRERGDARRLLAKAGIGAFAVLGGTVALAAPASAVRPAEPASVAVAPSTTFQATATTIPTSITASYSSASAVRGRVVTEALKHRGALYKYGATGPTRFDCSGFTLYVFRKFGVNLPHRARDQRYRGHAVSRAQARPGDLVVFSQGGSWGHVGIYLGNGKMIDAPHSGARVQVRKIWTNAVVFRRLIG